MADTYYSPDLSISILTLILVSPFILLAIIKSVLSRPDGHKPISTTEVSGLYVYPINSCRGFQINRVLLHMQGLDLDRLWMIVDARTQKFLSIRELPKMTLPKMTLIKTGLNTNRMLHITVPGDEANSVIIPTLPSAGWLETNTTLARVQIWNTETDGYLYGPPVNDLFSHFLRREVCLVYKGPTPRILRGNGSPEILRRTQDTFFQDVHPVTIASETSLPELNSRLVAKEIAPMAMERFRPNIIVKGNAPWA